jgi:hypothetical protein
MPATFDCMYALVLMLGRFVDREHLDSRHVQLRRRTCDGIVAPPCRSCTSHMVHQTTQWLNCCPLLRKVAKIE